MSWGWALIVVVLGILLIAEIIIRSRINRRFRESLKNTNEALNETRELLAKHERLLKRHNLSQNR